MSPKKIFAVLILTIAVAAASSAQTAVGNGGAGINTGLACPETDVRFLSDSTCTGRGSATRGYVEAAAYVARRLSEIPGMEMGGFEGQSWFKTFALPDSRAGHNVIGVLPATVGAKYPKYILVLASLDGRGTMNGTVYPGADSNASGVAAGLAVAARLSGCESRPYGVIFAFLDGRCSNSAGALDLLKSLKTSSLKEVVGLDIIGSSMSPVVKYKKDYLIALGGAVWSKTLERLNNEKSLGLHLTYDYYGSRDFTNLFYRKVGDHKPFLDKGVPCVVFTSGITMMTNKPSDTFDTLDYPLLSKRIDLIASWIASIR